MDEVKKTDLREKGAIVQRDYQTFAIAPHLPGGICDVGIQEKDLDDTQVLDVSDKIILYYRGLDTKKRMGRVITQMGMDAFRNEIGI